MEREHSSLQINRDAISDALRKKKRTVIILCILLLVGQPLWVSKFDEHTDFFFCSISAWRLEIRTHAYQLSSNDIQTLQLWENIQDQFVIW